MPELVVSNAGLCRLIWSIGGQQANNVMGVHIQKAGAVDQADADAVADTVRLAASATAFLQGIDQGTSLIGVTLRDIRTPNEVEWPGTFTPIAGTWAGEHAGHEVAICVTLRTLKAGKKFTGRSYIPFNGGGYLDEETASYNNTAVDAAEAFFNDIKTGWANSPTLGGDFHLAVVSRPQYSESGTQTWPGACHQVQAVEVRSPIKTTQRRRIPHRG